MNIFNTILQKLGIEKPAAPAVSAPSGPSVNLGAVATSGSAPVPAAPAPAAPAPAAPAPAPAAPVVAESTVSSPPIAPAAYIPAAAAPASSADQAPAAPVAPVAVPMVDVVSKLEGLSRSRPDLDWKVSIVDLLKLLGISDTLEDLANELNCPAFEMADSARRNIWLHKTVLQKIAENGGNIPANLLK